MVLNVVCMKGVALETVVASEEDIDWYIVLSWLQQERYSGSYIVTCCIFSTRRRSSIPQIPFGKQRLPEMLQGCVVVLLRDIKLLVQTTSCPLLLRNQRKSTLRLISLPSCAIACLCYHAARSSHNVLWKRVWTMRDSLSYPCDTISKECTLSNSFL